jgi:serine protease
LFIETLVNPGDIGFDPFYDDSHETAVLGKVIGTSNDFGIKGISHGATAKVAPEMTNAFWHGNRANAIVLALCDGKPGDVILLEMQTGACGGACGEDQVGCRPAKEDQDVFDAMQVAVGKGLIVVATAGNGNVDLDSPQCGGQYNRINRDSGAIFVGAGGSGASSCCPACQKMDYSTFGSSVDMHGWGDCVWTMGYGDGHQDIAIPTDRNKW